MTNALTLQGNVSSNIFNAVNTQYSQIDKAALATKILKGSINAEDAVVNLQGITGIAGFKFHIPQTEQIRLESEITDFYTDTNTPVQDHIVRKPVIITLTGLVGDYFYSVNQISDMLARVIPTLTLVKQFLPKISEAAQQTLLKKYQSRALQGVLTSQNVVNPKTFNIKNLKVNLPISVYRNNLYNYEFNKTDLFKLFQDLYKLKSEQTKAYYFFEALWLTETLFSIETTWRRFDNMALQSVMPVRDNNADITEFQATFKQINFTQSKTESAEAVAGRMKQQAADITPKGETKGEEVSDV